MAASQKILAIKLTENDVPGAKFRCNEIEEHSVCELKRWLQCRGLPVTGNKSELVRRCLCCIEASEDGEIVVSVDGGSWYQRKVTKILQASCADQLSEVPLLPATGWSKFPSKTVPSAFSYGTIYDHIIATAVVYDPDGEKTITDFGTSKPMHKGRQYFASGHVKDIEDHQKHGCYFLKCKVLASYEADKNYNVTLTLDSNSAKVLDASCECRASAMSRCNHVAGILFALEDYTIRFGYQPTSATSELCKWNVGRKAKRDPKPCHEAAYNKKLKSDRIITHDPRPQHMIPDDESFVNNFVATIPNAGSNTMFRQIMEINYNDYVVDTDHLRKLSQLTIDSLKENIQGNQPIEIDDTQGQTTSDSWYKARSLRVTASNAKTVTTTKSKQGQYNLLKRLLWSNKVLDLKALKYGRENEDLAFEKFQEGSLTPGHTLTKSGFWVNPKYPELGCSPDGLIWDCNKKLVGVLEIKCPFVLKNSEPTDLENLSKKQINNLCFRIENGALVLKRTHSYYFQIQMQIAICEVEFCDFTIWSQKGMCVERIQRDVQFWDALFPKLIDFHHNVLVPEYFEQRIPRRLFPVNLNLDQPSNK